MPDARTLVHGRIIMDRSADDHAHDRSDDQGDEDQSVHVAVAPERFETA
jgi:hypothetical protein